MRDRDFEEDIDHEINDSPYCPICTGCGEEMCCSPIHCKGSGGSYCDWYLRDLKMVYDLFQRLNPEVPQELFDEVYDKWHPNKNEK